MRQSKVGENAQTFPARLDLYFRCNGFDNCNALLHVGVLVAGIAEAVEAAGEVAQEVEDEPSSHCFEMNLRPLLHCYH